MSHLSTLRSIFLFLLLLLTFSGAGSPQSATAGERTAANESATVHHNLDEKDFGSLKGRVTADAAKDHQANMSGIRVVLRRLNAGLGAFVFDRVTTEDGEFSFNYLRPGQYQIEIDRRTVPAAIPDPARKVAYITVDLNKETRLDLTLSPAATIAGVVYLDADRDGRFDPAKDSPIAGASVIVDGQTIFSARDGWYSIADVATGRQSLLVSWPNGQKSRVVLDLDPGRRPRTVNIGTDDKARTQPAATATIKAPLIKENSVAEKPVRSGVNPYLPSALTGQGYVEMVAFRPNVPVEPLVQKTVQSRPTHGGFEPTYDLTRRARYAGASIPEARAHLKGYSTGDPELDTYIVDSSTRNGVDPLLIYAQMGQESSYKTRALSPKGASGLMQLMPATARRMGVTNIYDPRQNIEGGVKYMRLLIDMFGGDLELALAGYNAGEGAVVRYGYQIPPYSETQDYVKRISSRYRAMSGLTMARTKASIPMRTSGPRADGRSAASAGDVATETTK
jgi:hypothetical protein